MLVVIGSDHAGFQLKEAMKPLLLAWKYEVEDLGTHSLESVDYPDFAAAVARRVVASRAAGESTLGLVACGTGIGVSIAANKIAGARAACCSEPYSAAMARAHNDANIICLGGRAIGPGLAENTLRVFLNTSFEGGRHQRRIDKIIALEAE